MGSGRGQTRRAQTVAETTKTANTTGKPVTFKQKKWEKFARDSKLNSNKLQQYYLGKSTSVLMTDTDYEQVLSELLADAATVGAITIPSPHQAEDFEFHVGYSPETWLLAEIAFKNEPERKVVLENPFIFEAILGGDVCETLRCTADGINLLLEG